MSRFLTLSTLVSFLLKITAAADDDRATLCSSIKRPLPYDVSLYFTSYSLPPYYNAAEDEMYDTTETKYFAKVAWNVEDTGAWIAPEKGFQVVCNVFLGDMKEKPLQITKIVSLEKRHATIDLPDVNSSQGGQIECGVRTTDYVGSSAVVRAPYSVPVGPGEHLRPAMDLLLSALDNRGNYQRLLFNPELQLVKQLTQRYHPEVLDYWMNTEVEDDPNHHIYISNYQQIVDVAKQSSRIDNLDALVPWLLYMQPPDEALYGLPFNVTQRARETVTRLQENFQNYLPHVRNNRRGKYFAVSDVAVDWINRHTYLAGIEPNASKGYMQSVLVSWMFDDQILYRTRPGYRIEQIVYCPITNRVYFSERAPEGNITLMKYETGPSGDSSGVSPFFSQTSNCNCWLLAAMFAHLSPAVALDWRGRSYAPPAITELPFRILWATEFAVWSSDADGCSCERVYSGDTANQFWKVRTDIYNNLYWLGIVDGGNHVTIVNLDTNTLMQSTNWRLGNGPEGDNLTLVEIYDIVLLEAAYRPLVRQPDECYMLPEQSGTPQVTQVGTTSVTLTVARLHAMLRCVHLPTYMIHVHYKRAEQRGGDACTSRQSQGCLQLEVLSNEFTLDNLEPGTMYHVQVVLLGESGRTKMSNATYFTTKTESESGQQVSGLVAATIILVALVLGAVACWVKEHRRRQVESGRRSKIKHYVGRAELRFIPSRLITTIKFLGRGHFGAVYEGIIYDPKTHKTSSVALKILQNPEASEVAFYREAVIMAQLNKGRQDHRQGRHVVELIGVCIDGVEPVLILELMAGGSLADFLRCYDAGCVPFPLTVSVAVDMCLQISEGMQFMHNLKIIQRDLRAENILRACERPNTCLKISDFGLARNLSENEVYFVNANSDIPLRHSAPEVFSKHNPDTGHFGIVPIKADVWSFGIMMWEVFSLGALPYADLKTETEVRNFVLNQAGHPSQPPSCPSSAWAVMTSCWAKDPADRPSFDDISGRLQQIKKELQRDSTKDHVLPMTNATGRASNVGLHDADDKLKYLNVTDRARFWLYSRVERLVYALFDASAYKKSNTIISMRPRSLRLHTSEFTPAKDSLLSSDSGYAESIESSVDNNSIHDYSEALVSVAMDMCLPKVRSTASNNIESHSPECDNAVVTARNDVAVSQPPPVVNPYTQAHYIF